MRRRKIASTVLGIVCVCTCLLTTSHAEDLPRQWQKKIDGKTVGAPYPGVIPPSIWAVAFSPDGQYLAVGIGIVESRRPPYTDYKSYVALVSVAQPESPMRIFETSAKPWANGPRIAWSADAKYLAIDYVSLLEGARLLDVETAREYKIPRDSCNVLGIVAGPRLVMGCFIVKKVIRLVNPNGMVESEWPVPGSTLNAGFAVTSGWLALAVDPNLAGGVINPYREFAIIQASDRAEISRWSFTEVYGWSGALSVSGSTFCNLFYDPQRSDWRRLACRDVPTGREIGSVPVELKRGRSGVPIAVGGNSRVTIDDPFLPSHRSVWDVHDGRRIAQWPIRVQKVLPKASWPAEFLNSKSVYPYTISPDGNTIAEGGSGIITLYNLPH